MAANRFVQVNKQKAGLQVSWI